MPLASSWIALVAEVPSALEDEAAATLGAESLGVETCEGGDGAARLRVFLPGDRDAEAERERAARALRGLGLDPDRCRLRFESVADGRWAERYQASLKPLLLGSGFVVIPDGTAAAEGARSPILLVPGRAFGTGEHETTRLCAAALERWVRPGSRWLDLGTGSGILAVVAARCGAALVWAVDDDADAIEVAREVVEANGEAARVRVRTGSADLLAGAGLDGCVANVAAPYFLGRARDVAAVLRPGGILLCSGILAAEADEVAAALDLAGLEPTERRDEGPWCLLVARAAARS